LILWGRKGHPFSSPFFSGIAIKRIKVNRYYLGDCSFANIIETPWSDVGSETIAVIRYFLAKMRITRCGHANEKGRAI